MGFPGSVELFRAIDATWAPESFQTLGPFTLRYGAGGGKRVSAASLSAIGSAANVSDINAAATAMRNAEQTPLFMIRDKETILDEHLEELGYSVIDPVTVYASEASELARNAVGGLAALPCEAPLALQREIWDEGGVGPERLAVMARSTTPKTYILGRTDDRPVGTVFASVSNTIGMLHALEVKDTWRRRGVGKALTFAAAKWAQAHGAEMFALLTVKNNAAACALYEKLGMRAIDGYHYRIATE